MRRSRNLSVSEAGTITVYQALYCNKVSIHDLLMLHRLESSSQWPPSYDYVVGLCFKKVCLTSAEAQYEVQILRHTSIRNEISKNRLYDPWVHIFQSLSLIDLGYLTYTVSSPSLETIMGAEEFEYATDRVWDLSNTLGNNELLDLYKLYLHLI